jgi:hypothetical protein
MLEGRLALDLALDLARMPTLGTVMRTHPLPPDTLVLIRIAAGCPETIDDAVRATGVSAGAIRDASVLYLQNVLFAVDADSRRVLGVDHCATRGEMREHLRWLMIWLHPDGNRAGWESIFAERVLRAWRDAGMPDGVHRFADGESDGGPPRSTTRPVHRWIALPLASMPRRGHGFAAWFRSGRSRDR